VQTGGGFYCGGVDTGLAGRKIDLAIIDDPIGLAGDAENPRVRESVWQWYQRDLRQRLNPNSAVIWIMSRWDPDDPVGRLIKHALANDVPMTLVDLPAIALNPEVDEAADATARRELQLPPGPPYRDARTGRDAKNRGFAPAPRMAHVSPIGEGELRLGPPPPSSSPDAQSARRPVIELKHAVHDLPLL
jgi:hypothetical protein